MVSYEQSKELLNSSDDKSFDDTINSLLADIAALDQEVEQLKTLENKNFFLSENIPESEIQDIINCNANNISVSFKSYNYDAIFNAINRINKLKSNVEFTIRLYDKNSFNNYIYNVQENLPFENVRISTGRPYETINFKEYYQKEKVLLDIVAPAKHLSPFERYVYAYNIVKFYKKYNKYEENWEESRSLYKVIDNEYIVCAGFTRLLEDLLDKLEIPSRQFGVEVYDPKTDNYYNHSLLQTKLVDEKYGINGIYYSDPTSDNNMGKDYYQYLLMSNVKYPYVPINGYDDTSGFFCINSVEEFYDYFTDWYNNQTNKDREVKFLLRNFLKVISKLDNKLYNQEYSKYEENLHGDIDMNMVNTLLDKIANYISNNLNKDVNEETIYNAVKELYSNYYGYSSEEDVNKALMQTIQDNDEIKQRMEEYFKRK